MAFDGVAGNFGIIDEAKKGNNFFSWKLSRYRNTIRDTGRGSGLKKFLTTGSTDLFSYENIRVSLYMATFFTRRG